MEAELTALEAAGMKAITSVRSALLRSPSHLLALFTQRTDVMTAQLRAVRALHFGRLQPVAAQMDDEFDLLVLVQAAESLHLESGLKRREKWKDLVGRLT